MAVKWTVAVAALCLLTSLVNCRVVENSRNGDDLQDRFSLNDLLQRADPYENDIFYEPRPEYIPVRRPQRPSPSQHLLQTFSRTRYVDASEFRRDFLPPHLDINRQLTLISASKRVVPPVVVNVQPLEDLQENFSSSVYFPNPSPLFREDFPFEDAVASPEEVTAALQKPTYSTSVSLSTSVSYSNKSAVAVDDKPTTKAPSLSTTEAPPTTSASVGETSNAETLNTKSVSDSEVTKARSIQHPGIVSVGEYSDYGALSPLAHILAGFGGEMGPFGGDRKADSYILGFRPDGF